MNSRPGTSRPMPAAPYDDPSIPVLTERLSLPELELDTSLPAPDSTASTQTPPAPPTIERAIAKQDQTAPALTTAPAPAAAITAAPPAPPEAPAAPALLGADFESDTWLVETIPLAPPPLDLSNLDLPTFDLPPLTRPAPPPAVAAPPSVDRSALDLPTFELPPLSPPAVAAPSPLVHAPQVPAPPAADLGFAAPDLVIPASLMRATPALASPEPAPVESAPTFDRLPARPAEIVTAPLPAVDTAAAHVAGAFAVAPAPTLPDTVELRAAILDALSQQLPQDVESILRRRLAPAIDAAVDAAAAQLIPEIRRAVAQSLRDLVDHAVQAELARLREPK